MRFEWDPDKATSNLAKHDVSFAEASSVFGDRLARTILDPDHTAERGEERWLTMGLSDQGRLLVVWHAEATAGSDSVVRIIGARKATSSERRTYESGE